MKKTAQSIPDKNIDEYLANVPEQARMTLEKMLAVNSQGANIK
ncbi:MAG: hypothetical protein ABIQ56_05550 [Chitinophagaceae bacterium]